MRRSMIATVVALAAIAGVGWYFISSSGEDAAPAAAVERKPAAVTVIEVVRREIAEEVNVSGTLVAREEVLVAPEVEGLAVTEILVEEGDRVTKDQVLARLSRLTVETQIAQADAQIAQARAQIAEAQASLGEQEQSLKRAESLRKSGTVSAEVYDQRVAAAGVGAARVEAAKQALAVAEAQRREAALRLDHTEIKAPTAGIVSRRTLRVGQIASMAASEPAFRIIENGDVELEADVVDVTLARLSVGQPVQVMPAGTDKAVEGRVRLISPRVDPATRLGRVRIAILSGEPATIGAFASGVVEIGRRETLVLPLQAITLADTGASVQRVNDDRVETRTVTIGLRAQKEVEIAEGLSEGDVVVARAGSFLRDGDRITPVAAATAEAKP